MPQPLHEGKKPLMPQPIHEGKNPSCPNPYMRGKKALMAQPLHEGEKPLMPQPLHAGGRSLYIPACALTHQRNHSTYRCNAFHMVRLAPWWLGLLAVEVVVVEMIHKSGPGCLLPCQRKASQSS
jgi:hypothetical protein